ncbi:VWA domain-containing protein [Streptomyces sp. NBC_01803]|uniref:VWA domain-containing protein n=1 Tax=Streptomyces sp. NBC_01803 TaxID=2975946 RepID=UPI002DD8F09F|nr:VWA domain-containing protein [Streptomyces sp. NBC_01803]WSA45239.1 VWA domain-containing protein [Streptomyces sp. NBC_01803]
MSPISLEKVTATAPDLVNLYKSAGVSLGKHRLLGVRAAVYLVLDRSGSMKDFYRDGTVQHLAEQALGLAAHFDDDGVVPTIFFSTDVHTRADLALGAHRGRIAEIHDTLGHMGKTFYAKAMRAVLDHYLASGTKDPAFVIFQTDGAPKDKGATAALLTEVSTLPVFWQFIGFGDDPFTFLRRLDDLAGRAVDNAGFFPAGADPRAVPSEELYDALMSEFPQWLNAARAAGVLS